MKENKRKSPFAKEKISFNELFLKISITIFVAVLFLVCFFALDGRRVFEKSNYVDGYKNYQFQLHSIDVENGDAFLLRLPENKTMLIDCGDTEYEDRVFSYLGQYMAKENLDKIDYLVLTHADSDHIGNAGAIIKKFKVQNVYRPKKYCLDEDKYIATDKGYAVEEGASYNNAITSAYEYGCNIIFNETGLKISLDNCIIDFLSPSADYYSEDNNYSAVLMIKYFSLKLLFMGDADSSIEQFLMSQYEDDLMADILKVGHHGSKTSTSEEFLNAVNPTYALLSCSENSSILPNSEVISRLEKHDINTLSTMELGNFALTIEGNSIKYSVSQPYFNFWAIIFSVLVILIIVMFKMDFSHKKETQKVKKRQI